MSKSIPRLQLPQRNTRVSYYTTIQRIDNLKDSLLCDTGFTGLPCGNKNFGTADCIGLSSINNGFARELPQELSDEIPVLDILQANTCK